MTQEDCEWVRAGEIICSEYPELSQPPVAPVPCYINNVLAPSGCLSINNMYIHPYHEDVLHMPV